MFQTCALPSVAQVSTAAEVVVPGTVLDLGQTDTGVYEYTCQETGGMNSIQVGVQTSNDGKNWTSSVTSGYFLQIMGGGLDFIGPPAISPATPSRFVRLSLIDTVAGLHGDLLVTGGFAK